MLEAIQNVLGVPAAGLSRMKPDGLPFYLLDGRDFYTVRLGGPKILFVSLSEDERLNAAALEKHLSVYMEKTGLPTAYVLPTLNRKQREALIRNKIPFVCGSEQIYLPFLGIYLTDRFVKQKTIDLHKLTPSSQVLFLYFLYKARDREVIKKQAAEDLGMTRMSVTRASEQLQALNLIEQETHGREVSMRAVAEGRELYELGRPYLIDPILKTITVRKTAELESLPYAGEYALSVHSMLNGPAIPVTAVDRKSKWLAEVQLSDERWEPADDLIRIECWKYDPNLFAQERSVDPASLAASLQEQNDERVQGELESYLEGSIW